MKMKVVAESRYDRKNKTKSIVASRVNGHSDKIILFDRSSSPVEGKTYQVSLVRDTKPLDRVAGALIVRIEKEIIVRKFDTYTKEVKFIDHTIDQEYTSFVSSFGAEVRLDRSIDRSAVFGDMSIKYDCKSGKATVAIDDDQILRYDLPILPEEYHLIVPQSRVVDHPRLDREDGRFFVLCKYNGILFTIKVDLVNPTLTNGGYQCTATSGYFRTENFFIPCDFTFKIWDRKFKFCDDFAAEHFRDRFTFYGKIEEVDKMLNGKIDWINRLVDILKRDDLDKAEFKQGRTTEWVAESFDERRSAGSVTFDYEEWSFGGVAFNGGRKDNFRDLATKSLANTTKPFLDLMEMGVTSPSLEKLKDLVSNLVGEC